MAVYALFDCNNYFVSCERAFCPRLHNRPVIVLSNNDGCVIARSNEVKALGIPMGIAFFKVKQICKKYNVAIFSSNYQLYADISERIMHSLRNFFTDSEIEVYSIDEAFVRLDDYARNIDLEEYLRDVSKKIYKWFSIPISIGLAPTKTLAKMANAIAKKQESNNFYSLLDFRQRQSILKEFAIEDIWGIGSKFASKLSNVGINNALELSRFDPNNMRRHYTVVGERIVRELNGIDCLELLKITNRKNIQSSRSFSKALTDYKVISQAVSNYAALACVKMRRQNSKARAIYVFITTSPFRRDKRQYCNSACYHFANPTSDSMLIISQVKKILLQIYRQGYAYSKAGVMLSDLVDANWQQYDLFSKGDSRKSEKLMSVIDSVNNNMGKNSLFYASQGIRRKWQMRSDFRSNRYTTNWQELALAS
jgi:DNA polymerase V